MPGRIIFWAAPLLVPVLFFIVWESMATLVGNSLILPPLEEIGALLAHPLGQAIPGPFDPEKRLFRSRKWEQNGRIYTKLAIDKWKKLVPDMSRILPDMVKKELPGSGAVTADQAAALVQETCRAELVHGASCLLGLAFLWLWPGWGGAIVLAVWVLLANLPFILIQRYNRPRLMRLAALLRKRAQRKGEQNARTDPDL